MADQPISVFYSYAHEDEPYVDALRTHLRILKRQGVIADWHDRKITAGQEWKGQIDEHLESASIILLLVSASFIDSDYCWDIELDRAMQRHATGEATVVPLAIRPCYWKGAPFGELQGLPKGMKPVVDWPTLDHAFEDIATGICRAAERIGAERSSQRKPDGTGASGQPQPKGLPAIWNVERRPDPYFVGRKGQLEALEWRLADGRAAITPVAGMGGIGKTQLAVEYVFLNRHRFDLVWWVRAESETTLLEDYAALARKLGLLRAEDAKLAEVAAVVREALERSTGWLLVLDNAVKQEAVEPYVPQPDGGQVLITSRDPDWPFAEPVPLAVFSQDRAVEFLRRRTGQDDREAAAKLANDLGHLPLALAQAGAYIARTAMPLADYRKLFLKQRKRLWDEEGPPHGYPDTVRATFRTALGRLDAAAADFMRLAAFLAPEPIPRAMLAEHADELPEPLSAAVADPIGWNRIVDGLRSYSLVEAAPAGLTVHRLVQAATRDNLDPDARHKWIEAAIGLMKAAFPHRDKQPETWVPSGERLAHALVAAGFGDDPRAPRAAAASLFNETGSYLEIRAEFDRARHCYERAVRIAEATSSHQPVMLGLGPSIQSDPSIRAVVGPRAKPEDDSNVVDPTLAIYVNNLGHVLQEQGDLAGAKAHYERALRIDERAYGPDHPNVAIGPITSAMRCGRGAIYRGRRRTTSGRSGSTSGPTAPNTRTWRSASTTSALC